MKINLNPTWLKPDLDRLHLRRRPARFWLIFCLTMVGLIGLLIIAHTILFILWSEPIGEEAITEDLTSRHQVNTNLLTKVAGSERARINATTTPVTTDPGLPKSLRTKLAE